jgi:acetyl esterase/lipase
MIAQSYIKRSAKPSLKWMARYILKTGISEWGRVAPTAIFIAVPLRGFSHAECWEPGSRLPRIHARCANGKDRILLLQPAARSIIIPSSFAAGSASALTRLSGWDMTKALITAGIILGAVLTGFVVLVIFSVNQLFRKPALYEVEGMDKVRVDKDITYKIVDGVDLKMDLYRPAGTDAPRPVVVLVQGGSSFDFLIKNAKDWRLFTSYGKILAASGLAAIAFNRRGESRNYEMVEASASDIRDLLSFVRDNANTFGLDIHRMSMWGFSAGSVFLSLPLEDPKEFRCLVSYYGLLDLRPYRKNISNKISDETMEKYSPVAWLDKHPDAPPMLIVKAGMDRNPEIPLSNDGFIEKANKLGLNVRLLTHETGHHSFDILDDNPRTREIIRETLFF